MTSYFCLNAPLFFRNGALEKYSTIKIDVKIFQKYTELYRFDKWKFQFLLPVTFIVRHIYNWSSIYFWIWLCNYAGSGISHHHKLLDKLNHTEMPIFMHKWNIYSNSYSVFDWPLNYFYTVIVTQTILHFTIDHCVHSVTTKGSLKVDFKGVNVLDKEFHKEWSITRSLTLLHVYVPDSIQCLHILSIVFFLN